LDIPGLHDSRWDDDGYVSMKASLVATFNRAKGFASATHNPSAHPSSFVLVRVLRLSHTSHIHLCLSFEVHQEGRWSVLVTSLVEVS